ncbi:phage baseplate assembly protein V [Sphingopyxis macrogoltabida]|uniref:Baseplate assembly protein n=1 Tax=Sphingopyxis macrogoltabida TaxID=33050 RepID=A0AAC8YZ70_SPHMC|nr:phage baseplate assembly protein V [Sphingopyxis macrogoltabida]ALJ13625.1 baseplate assembly protein [Sphingopyxis macrogoltabida]AMU88930.1 baseplate assembly protein [Sphingopyxis macrogoltabida]
MTAGPRYFGKYRATVLNNLDAQNQGRIQVQLGDRYGLFPSTWALPCLPFAGKGSSAVVALPAIGSMVWVEFEAGDPDFPIWTGGFWPDPAGFPMAALVGATPVTPNIHLQTTTGTTVTLSDNPAQQVKIQTIAGAMISIGASGIIISNGQGASIAMSGPSVVINGGALTIT